MLDIQDLHIRFRNAPEGREAVKGISLHMDEGEILGLVGESGSGKTVTAMALAGLLSHAKTELSGAIFFQGLDLLQASRETVRALRGKEIAVVFHEPMTSMDPVMRSGPPVEEALVVHTQLSAEPGPSRPWQMRNCRRHCIANIPTSSPGECSSGPWWRRPSFQSPSS